LDLNPKHFFGPLKPRAKKLGTKKMIISPRIIRAKRKVPLKSFRELKIPGKVIVPRPISPESLPSRKLCHVKAKFGPFGKQAFPKNGFFFVFKKPTKFHARWGKRWGEKGKCSGKRKPGFNGGVGVTLAQKLKRCSF